MIQYAHRKGWVVEEGDRTTGPDGGFRRLVLDIRGADAYARLQWIQGTHRVQRVDEDPQGRVHTSVATVVVSPTDSAEDRVRVQHRLETDPREKIRTYNYPQDRVTDHRIGVTFRGLDQVVGLIDVLADILDALGDSDR